MKLTHEVKLSKIGPRGGKKVLIHRVFAEQSAAFEFMNFLSKDYNENTHAIDYLDTSIMKWKF